MRQCLPRKCRAITLTAISCGGSTFGSVSRDSLGEGRYESKIAAKKIQRRQRPEIADFCPLFWRFAQGWFPKGVWRMFPGSPKAERRDQKPERRHQKTGTRVQKTGTRVQKNRDLSFCLEKMKKSINKTPYQPHRHHYK